MNNPAKEWQNERDVRRAAKKVQSLPKETYLQLTLWKITAQALVSEIMRKAPQHFDMLINILGLAPDQKKELRERMAKVAARQGMAPTADTEPMPPEGFL